MRDGKACALMTVGPYAVLRVRHVLVGHDGADDALLPVPAAQLVATHGHAQRRGGDA